jgi:hypothetical protein
MKKENTIKDILEIAYKTFLLIGGFLFAFAWTVIGVTLIPQIAQISREGSLVPLLTSLGVLMGTIVIIYLTLSNLIRDSEKEGK